MAVRALLVVLTLTGLAGLDRANAQAASSGPAFTAFGAPQPDINRINRIKNRIADLEFEAQNRRAQEQLARLRPGYVSLTTFVDGMGRERRLVGGDVPLRDSKLGERSPSPGRSVALSLPDRGLEGPTVAAIEARLRHTRRAAEELRRRSGGADTGPGMHEIDSELTTIELDIARLEHR
jgi:hypothetical protein